MVKAQYDRMEPGMNLVNSPGQDETDTSIPYMIDADGEIRWILDWETVSYTHLDVYKRQLLKFCHFVCGGCCVVH